ncbi:hypothetical protein BOX15_Mlig007368g1 [Macrostomum lignano]|uniref:UDP-N-acetylglucosamine diphosphorylase n=2 Tax=Macrostomum lignano TaxID=282301 RepID=A0A267E6R0_9PLAT|nr:hypothetical protein BOX15_Mlig007368g1 [Macrostomum lignano]
MSLASRLENARQQLSAAGQLHLLNFYDSLTESEQAKLLKHIERVDWPALPAIVKDALAQRSEAKNSNTELEADDFRPIPPDACGGRSYTAPEEVARLRDIGLEAVADGRVGVILLAGGQATRLGVRYPKGLYEVGLPSGKSLFQLHAEKAVRVQAMAEQRFPGRAGGGIVWYIMTSEATQAGTVKFFEQQNYFGLRRENVVFFKQFTFPCVGLDGRVLLADRHRIQSSPDGNGGLYRAFRERGCLEHVRQRGLTCLQIFGVDNILTRVADPDFIGFCLDKLAEMGAKIVEKTSPLERVGVVTLGSDGAYRVVEYSEISASAASRADPAFPDRLLLRAGNICQHFLTADGLAKACQPEYETRMRYHAAVKRVPYCDPDTGCLIDSPPAENAIKLEKFVFDVFPFAGPKFVVWEVPRESEFSPLKNGPSASSECPNTCRRDLLALHSTWISASDTFQAFLRQNSKTDASSTEVEVSPLLSYSGEDLANRSDWQEQVRSGGITFHSTDTSSS